MHLRRDGFVDQVDDEFLALDDVARGVLHRPAGAVFDAEITIGGSSASTLKKLKGAALTTPLAPRLVTSAIGRGTTRLVSSL